MLGRSGRLIGIILIVVGILACLVLAAVSSSSVLSQETPILAV